MIDSDKLLMPSKRDRATQVRLMRYRYVSSRRLTGTLRWLVSRHQQKKWRKKVVRSGGGACKRWLCSGGCHECVMVCTCGGAVYCAVRYTAVRPCGAAVRRFAQVVLSRSVKPQFLSNMNRYLSKSKSWMDVADSPDYAEL